MALTFRSEPAFEKHIAPELPGPDRQPERGDPRLEISVVYTTPDAAMSALRRAAVLAGNLSARVTLIVPQVVPYPLPLTTPPVLLDFQESRLRQIASQCPAETVVRIYLCRNRWELLHNTLRPHSLVVLGGRSEWRWLTRERRLARRLRKAGHEVIVAPME